MAEKKMIMSKTMIELFVLHSWPKYIESKNAVRTFDGSTITPQRLLDMGASAGFVDEAFHMFKQISRLKLTDEAIGILCSLVVFSPDRQYPIELAESKFIHEFELCSLIQYFN